MIVSSHVLEHLEHDRAAIAEFARTLRPGGQAVVMVPTRPDWRTAPTREFGAPDLREGHWRLYGGDFAQRLRASGLEDRTIPTAGLASAEACELLDDAIFIARKPSAAAL
jgi:SAM-dependent methyltransferase